MGKDNREWIITDHICRICMGRILVTYDKDAKKTFRCSNCSVELQGRNTDCLCCCGMKIGGRDAGIRCVKNQDVTPEWPSEIVAEQIDPGAYRGEKTGKCR